MAEIDEFPSIETLAASDKPLDSYSSTLVEKWRSLSPELQAMVPHVAELIIEGMGGRATWKDLNPAKRNIMIYTAAILLAEARKRSEAKQ